MAARLLLDDWFITTVGEQSAGVGAMSFEGGEGALSVEWSDDAAMAEFVTTHDDETEVTTGTMLGSAVTVHRPNPTASADKQLGAASDETMVIGNADTYLSAAVVTGDRTVRAYSDELSPDDFVAAIASLRVAERSEWEATLPADIVTPAQRGAVIDPMIADVPTPDGLDVSDLRNERLIQPRHSIAFELGRAITCAWLRQWVDAAAAGDTAAATEATDALSSVDGWRPWLASGSPPRASLTCSLTAHHCRSRRPDVRQRLRRRVVYPRRRLTGSRSVQGVLEARTSATSSWVSGLAVSLTTRATVVVIGPRYDEADRQRSHRRPEHVACRCERSQM